MLTNYDIIKKYNPAKYGSIYIGEYLQKDQFAVIAYKNQLLMLNEARIDTAKRLKEELEKYGWGWDEGDGENSNSDVLDNRKAWHRKAWQAFWQKKGVD